MPDFPRYQSQATPTTQQPSVQAPTDNTGEVIAQVGQNIGSTVQKVALNWEEKKQSTRKSVATYNLKSKIMAIEERVTNEVDPQKENDYKNELKSALSENSKDLDSLSILELRQEADISAIRIGHRFKTLNLELDAVATQNLIDMEINNPSPGSFQKIKSIIDEKVATGFMGVPQGEKLYKDSVKTLGEFSVANDPATEESQSQVLAELKKGDKGTFSEIPPDDRLSLIKASQQRIFNNNQTFKRDIQDASNERSNNLIEKLASGEGRIADIEAELAVPEEQGGMKRSQLLTYKRAVVSGIKGDLNRMLQEKTPDKDPTKRAKAVKNYLELIDDYISDESDQLKAKEKLAQAYEDGNVDAKEQQFLNAMKQSLKDIEFNRNAGLVANSIRGIKDFFGAQSNASDEDLARNIKSLVGEIQNGTPPRNAMRMVLSKQILSYFPDYATYEETGRLKQDANGNQILIFPDGTTEVPQKKASK